MKTFTCTFKAYTFSELSDKAKDRARRDYLDSCRPAYIFTEDCGYRLSELYPNSDLKVNYDLGYCQGDGLNIDGKLDLSDFLPRWKGRTEKEFRRMSLYLSRFSWCYTLERNMRYGYSCKFLDRRAADDVAADYADDLLYYTNLTNIDRATLKKFFLAAIDELAELDALFERDGYSWFYEATDTDVLADSEANGWLYNDDGTAFPYGCMGDEDRTDELRELA